MAGGSLELGRQLILEQGQQKWTFEQMKMSGINSTAGLASVDNNLISALSANPSVFAPQGNLRLRTSVFVCTSHASSLYQTSQ
jgi:hypothetical protein